MTYKQTLDWMFEQLPMYQKKGKSAFNAKLDKTLALAAHLGHPEKKFKSIHVGGTNGKGSSSHMLASVLQEAGYKTGLYTSPHLKDFRERIKINGNPIDEEFVVNFIHENLSFFNANGLSFFEMCVGMAFDYFAQQKVDIAIVEVGLGGRLDSTNIIVPEVALITNIGWDHVDLLGDTLPKIAFEKAGIIKSDVPVVIGEYQEDTAEVFEAVAASKNAELVYADRDVPNNYETGLLGAYQTRNVKGVVAILRRLPNFKIAEQHIVAGLNNVVQNTGLMGRWQVLGTAPTVICDTAHNAEGLTAVLDQLVQQHYDKLHIVLGFVKDKNLDAILPLFPKNAEYYFCRPDIPRGLDVEKLREHGKSYGLRGKSYPSVGGAYRIARECASPTDFIFIGGSTFTVAEVV